MNLHLLGRREFRRNEDGESRNIVGCRLGEMVAHLAVMTPAPGLADLHLAEQAVTLQLVRAVQRKPKAQLHDHSRPRIRQEGGEEFRERSKRFWLGDNLVPHQGEAVIGGNEKIVASDVAGVVERRLVWFHLGGEHPPLLFDGLGLWLPRRESVAVDFLLLELCRAADVSATATAAPVALAVDVVEGFVSC